jgi:putative acetyltransferase
MKITIRSETAADQPAIWRVHGTAFGTAAEADLVDALRRGGYVTASLVAERDGQIVGHILFSRAPIVTPDGMVEAVALAPLAVVPEQQRQGIGSQLVSAGMEACRRRGDQIVLVLGHPDYYPRFGFSPALARLIWSPFGGGDSWMAAELVPNALQGVAGRVAYAPPFNAVGE